LALRKENLRKLIAEYDDTMCHCPAGPARNR